MKPSSQIIVPKVFSHLKYSAAKAELGSHLQLPPANFVIVVVGPTRGGKSVLKRWAVRELGKLYTSVSDDFVPFVDVELYTAQDGRISPRYLCLKLLKQLRHPVYAHVGDFDELDYYVPSHARSEAAMRNALDSALAHRRTEISFLDEAHILTHTGDRDLRNRILQSVKYLCSGGRTLFMFGGYELVYQGLFDSAHFAGRLIVIELEPYEKKDLNAWITIQNTIEKHIDVEPGMLQKLAPESLAACNGSYGLVEKALIIAKGRAAALGEPRITEAIFRSAFASAAERDTIAKDIKSGRLALSRWRGKKDRQKEEGGSKPTRHRGRPFKRNPRRDLPEMPEAEDE